MGVKFFAAVVLSVLVSPFAMADKMGPQGDKFYEEAAHFTNACSDKTCKAPYSFAVLYNQKTKSTKLPAVLKDQLKKVAWEQAQIWGDTILEGDYTSSGYTRLDLVTAFYKDQKLVGYTIQYSEKAWYTGECDYDGTRDTLKGCQEGRISEVSYVSPDLKTFFTDEDKHADFASEEIL
ncbi:hypothetical protein [Bdellovibrio svalbardensis]|uniref:Periplasmic protein n=1 Tax=Bdellovibrio svalbardensis TaxID=2972972 RepID=A0ABT6DH22_9BACT|nr:hypothetical protein [Bdellovibrio svalbardensis]MDG0815209.1 hypothetical protein [Bdellovibrio svalbardensis]